MDVIERLNERKARDKNARFLRQFARILWVEKFYFYTTDLTAWQPPQMPRMRLNATFCLGEEQDVDRLCSDIHLDAMNSKEVYQRKLRSGDTLLLGKLNEDIVFYLWVVRSKKELMNKTITLPEGQVAIERGFTRKEYRGHGFFMFGLNYLFPLLKEEGSTSCLTEIATHNLPMIRTALKMGFKKLDSYYYWIKTPLKQYSYPVLKSNNQTNI